MKKSLIAILTISLFLITGCSEEDRQLKGLISDQEGIYGLYVVEDEKVDGSILSKEGIDESKIHIIFHPKSLEVAQEDLSTIKIEKSPAYIVMDHKGVALKTYDYEELVKYLKERINKK